MESLTALVEKVRPFTMVPERSLLELARQVWAILTLGIPGHLVECGVWRGGAAFLMAEVLRHAGVRDRSVWLFDSFEGLPPPQEIDGAKALAYPQNRADPWYHDNCRASLEDVRGNAASLGLTSYLELVKGWFDQSLPANRDRIGPIALLRIDGDWYASVRGCLENLYDQVVEGGLVVLDDYFAWDGCSIAVHEFLGSRRLAHRIEGVVGTNQGVEIYESAVFCKSKGRMTWQWMYHEYVTAQQIGRLVAPGETLILADQAQLGRQVTRGRRALPFLERDEQYGGLPRDDREAICELERLRESGARFFAFAWPAFWWFEHYRGFHEYLRTRFPCLLADERLVVFDLRPVR